ncbi:zinc-binding protein [Fulvimarina pelagi HTCC2506]|uniref:DNA gyrase inhibitor YacG n=1 Tax=Fulvimarina pelagi HTCC2506 TaxID=314231 RepID=Q0FYC6_9HYPH|nr:DNA gyrase inhibitor YacG [Fulvimarina pelagi]EAU40069.1 zinc-binding protein [Fulvimarina pelagi HTCC2506]
MTETISKVTPLRRKRKCPECNRESSREHFPFCSERCKAVDLNRWLAGSYVIPDPSVSAGNDEEES